MELTAEERQRIIERELARLAAEKRTKRITLAKRVAWACLSCVVVIAICVLAVRSLTGFYPGRQATGPGTATPYPTHRPPPTYTPSPVVPGIGLSRADIQSVFERELGYRFQPEDFASGQPLAWGIPPDYSDADLSLFGPPEELVAASITIALRKDNPPQGILNVGRMITLLKLVAPGWEGRSAWLEDNISIARTTGEVETFYGDLRIQLRCIGIGVVSLNVDAKGASFW